MDFTSLYQIYGGMTRPAYTLQVGGQTLAVGDDVRLLRAVCELTCRQRAGYLQVEAILDPEGENGSVWLNAFQVGAKCSFSLGYGSSKTKVFCGFLYEASWNDPLAQGPLGLEAVFLDVRGRLMASSCADAGSVRTMSQMLRTIFSQNCCTDLASSQTVKSVPEDWDLPALRLGLSDYETICRLASFLCYEFYAWADELYFGPPRPNSRPAVTFCDPTGLMEFRRRRTLAGQCGAVVVSGADDKGEPILTRQARSPDSGFGSDEMCTALSNDLHQPEPTIRTMAQAQYLAKARMETRQHQAGGVIGRCLGTPELRPGRFLNASGLSEAVNGTYYVHTVRHILDVNGYETYFEAEE